MAYRLTSRRRQSILKAQRVSAQRRSSRGHGTKLIKMMIGKSADTLTKGGAGKITDFFDKNEKKSKRRTRAKRKAARVKRRSTRRRRG